MQYALLIYERPGSYDGLSEEELESLTAEYMAIRSDERVLGGAHLAPANTATTVRLQDGKSADRRSVRGDEGGLRRVLSAGCRRPG